MKYFLGFIAFLFVLTLGGFATAADLCNDGRESLTTQVRKISSATEFDPLYCEMPEQFMNETTYQAYCLSQTCLRAGQQAGVLISSCCSRRANAQSLCVGSKWSPALPGEYCENGRECASGICDQSGRVGFCAGSSRPGQENMCGPYGVKCSSSSDCCSGRCDSNRCVGSPSAGAPMGARCNNSDECSSRYCNAKTRRCDL